jgi:hypothetical protein
MAHSNEGTHTKAGGSYVEGTLNYLAHTMEQKDFIATDLKFPDRTGEIYSVAYNPEQRWFYFPRMQPDEAMLLKCYDSMEDGRARFTAHSAFTDPTAPADAPPRESIETRTFVFFAPEA